MRGNRKLVLVAIILLMVVGAAGFLWWRSQQKGGTETPEGSLTPTPPTYIQIVVSAQNIPKGMQIKPEDFAVVLQDWPIDSLPAAGYFTTLEELNGKFAATDIPLGVPILPSMVGTAGPALFPKGLVAYVIPLDVQGAVAWAPQQGDHVDVLAAIQLVGVDPEFQSRLPNQFIALPVGENQSGFSGTFGRFEKLPNNQPALIYPAGEAYPTLYVQLTVQDAIVWHIGIWQPQAQTTPSATPPPDGGGLGIAAGGQTAAPTPPPSGPIYGDIEPVTLLVKPQDALVLKYLMEMGADLDLVLRPSGDTAPAITEPVWLRYILDKYQIPAATPDLPVVPTPLRTPIQLTPAATPSPQG